MSSEITQDMVTRLVHMLRARGVRNIEHAREDMLDHAAERMRFTGDETALWAEVKAAFGSGPARSPAAGVPAPVKIEAWSDALDEPNVTAPYRFTPVNEKVSVIDTAMTPLNAPQPGNLYAVLDVTWEVETPILIGQQAGENAPVTPFQLGNDWRIPGATLRGTIRAVAETAGMGRLFQADRHKRFALRDFQHPYYKEFMDADVKAGWLTKIGDKPHLTPCDLGTVLIADILGPASADRPSDWIVWDHAGKYGHQKLDWNGAAPFTKTQKITVIDAKAKTYRPDPRGVLDGYLVFSGRFPGSPEGRFAKKKEYVFFDQPGAAPIALRDDDWDAFETLNCKPSANQRKPDGAWKVFEPNYKSEKRVPVFYVGNPETGNDFSFGLTRLYRLPHKYSVREILLKSGADHAPFGDDGKLRPDFVEHLFGFVHEPAAKAGRVSPDAVARKGRVAFEFSAPLAGFTLDGEVTTIMGTPRPSFAPFYLSGPNKDYSSDNPLLRLAGRKRYVARTSGGDAAAALRQLLATQNAGVKGEVKSRLHYLTPAPGAGFTARIRLHNVSAAELGCVLWALTFGGNPACRHMLGRGKAFGAGQCFASAMTVHSRPVAEWDNPAKIAWKSTEGRSGIEGWLAAFEAAIKDLTGLDVASGPAKELIALATPAERPAAKYAYLPYLVAGQSGQAKKFKALRDKTGMKADIANHRLHGNLLRIP